MVGDLVKGDENRGDQFRRLTKFAGEHQVFVQCLETNKTSLKFFPFGVSIITNVFVELKFSFTNTLKLPVTKLKLANKKTYKRDFSIFVDNLKNDLPGTKP